ncbi:MAG: DUF4270 domain-containing protein [Bacteroides sp.]
MKVKYLWIALAALTFFGCDDNTAGLGIGLMPEGDKIPAGDVVYPVTTQSILSDSVYAKSGMAYLGKYTDPDFGTFEADFLAQFTCTDNYEFPTTLQGNVATSAEIRLYYTSYFGDSLATCRLRVDSLDRDLTNEFHYTNINPADFYNQNAKPLAYKAYTAVDLSVKDSIRHLDTYYPNVRIKLPTELGTHVIRQYLKNKDYFKNADEFIKNVFKGIYVRCDHGDGSILYIEDMSFNVNFKYLIKGNASGKIDSLVTGTASFSSTKEVVQANHFVNKGKLKELVGQTKNTYLKSPAGIFTKVTLPIDSFIKNNQTDTINSVKLAFTSYNKISANLTPFKMSPPKYLLMVREKDMYTFFEKNKLADGITSYLIEYGSFDNQYVFNNIARLVTTCKNEYPIVQAEMEKDKIEAQKKGETDIVAWEKKWWENTKWNKAVLIPVSVIKDSNKEIVGIRHDLQLNSAKLKGGIEGDKLDMKIVYTYFKK